MQWKFNSVERSGLDITHLRLPFLSIRGALGWKRTPELAMLRFGHCRDG